MTIKRHKLLYRPAQNPVCDCGYDPGIIMELEDGTPPTWFEVVLVLVGHLKLSRRWKYLGVEFHYGLGYYIWENGLSRKRHAIQEVEYLALTGVARNPRLQVTWSA